jgi:hypothetical protein
MLRAVRDANLSTPPSQGKVERARSIFNVYCSDYVWSNEREQRILAAISAALTEYSRQGTDRIASEASAILRTLASVPDNADISETDAKVSVGLLRRLLASGQGADGAEAMREAAASIYVTTDEFTVWYAKAAFAPTPINLFRAAVKEYQRRIRALPLPVSAGGSVDNTCGCVLCDFDLIPRDLRNHVTRAGMVYPCTNRVLRALKSKQPSDTGAGK